MTPLTGSVTVSPTGNPVAIQLSGPTPAAVALSVMVYGMFSQAAG
jgi:hypothetical protein